ncbi:hypothetical protein PPL_05420 [Heterostelium album PN500]|uniref:Uncharacterized protein n=1 Tax=Heterostelium pallidum (strain ATCC 26659 / Pp 5 / PN500) TaxID=670386 RepID=D3BA45_HETP5|nr:hypothetical protein PPL_05420 [Heterostelium album PN500]EFA81432.1 hypothetical protein PPL_05420 [Heterostelium album PN500]|eukprot:XP_020433550.1 hypothetical protein PPL_05420 [Heterostelium album PN500]
MTEIHNEDSILFKIRFRYSEHDEQQRRRVLNIFANYQHSKLATIANHGIECYPIDPPLYREDTSVANNTVFMFISSLMVALLVIDFQGFIGVLATTREERIKV